MHAKTSNVFKGDEFYGLLDGGPDGGKSVQMVQNNGDHAARRRIMDKAMPVREQLFHDINNLAQEFASVVEAEARSHTDGSIDVALIASWYSFDVISTVAFGKSLNMMQSETWRWVPLCLQEASTFLYAAGYAPFLPFWRWLLASRWPTRLGLTTVAAARQYADLAAERVLERITRYKSSQAGEKVDSRDIFGTLIRCESHSAADLRSESSLLIAAGSDAVRLVIAATLFYWLKNPRVMAKAVAEIRSLELSSNEDVTEKLLGSLKYLHACVDETMRLAPPKPGSIPREVQVGGILIDGTTVPRRMTIGVSTYTLHRDPDIFENPGEYRPERWLERPQDPRMMAAFCPFLKGPRACPGKTVAYFAMQLALFHLVWRYDISGGKAVEPQTGLRYAGMPGINRQSNDYIYNDWVIGYAAGPIVRLVRKA